jgi:hypothetical protein
VADKKTVFIAFAIEDEKQRDLLKGQSLHPRAPYEFIDMSVKQPYDKDWKDRVRTRIKRSDGVIVLVSKDSLNLAVKNGRSPARKKRKRRFGASGLTPAIGRISKAYQPSFGATTTSAILSTRFR